MSSASISTGFSSAYVAFVLPAVIGLNQDVGRLVAGLGQQSRDLGEGAREIGSRGPRLDVFQFIIISDTRDRSEEHTSELQSLMRISYAVFCLKKKKTKNTN